MTLQAGECWEPNTGRVIRGRIFTPETGRRTKLQQLPSPTVPEQAHLVPAAHFGAPMYPLGNIQKVFGPERLRNSLNFDL
jgi:hypothetical protein